jgi:DNA-binding SARP family transcriptional activator
LDHVSGDTRFGILGPLAAVVSGRDVTPRAAHERSLLALLLTAPGRVLSVGEIVFALWGAASPRQAERGRFRSMSRACGGRWATPR